jgi:hypothetical protein
MDLARRGRKHCHSFIRLEFAMFVPSSRRLPNWVTVSICVLTCTTVSASWAGEKPYRPSPTASSDAAFDETADRLALWHRQDLVLNHQALTVFYSCGELSSRVASILGAVGVQVRTMTASGCIDFAPSQRLEIGILGLIEANEENTRTITSFSAEQELLARLRGKQLPSSMDVELIRAQWRTIRLGKNTKRLRLEASDCSLVTSLRNQVFPKLAVRLRSRSSVCIAAASSIKPHIVLDALMPLGEVDDAIRL